MLDVWISPFIQSAAQDGFSRFLYADPTPNALQVFLPRPGIKQTDSSGLPAEEGAEEGIWITADPIPGYVVCNIGESESCAWVDSMVNDLGRQCGRSGQMDCIALLYTASFIEGQIIGKFTGQTSSKDDLLTEF